MQKWFTIFICCYHQQQHIIIVMIVVVVVIIVDVQYLFKHIFCQFLFQFSIFQANHTRHTTTTKNNHNFTSAHSQQRHRRENCPVSLFYLVFFSSFRFFFVLQFLFVLLIFIVFFSFRWLISLFRNFPVSLLFLFSNHSNWSANQHTIRNVTDFNHVYGSHRHTFLFFFYCCCCCCFCFTLLSRQNFNFKSMVCECVCVRTIIHTHT